MHQDKIDSHMYVKELNERSDLISTYLMIPAARVAIRRYSSMHVTSVRVMVTIVC